MNKQTRWVTIGNKNDLIPNSGVGTQVGSEQVALFWIPELDNRVFAVSNYCPFSGVHIIARGIIGDIAGEPVVASPLYKQHFSLTDGHCIEKPEVILNTWEVRLKGDDLQVLLKAAEEMAA
jgi:nitrite reductase (NADH) small subunit